MLISDRIPISLLLRKTTSGREHKWKGRIKIHVKNCVYLEIVPSRILSFGFDSIAQALFSKTP